MKILLSHPTGNQFVRALLEALETAGQLGEFATTFAVKPDAMWLTLLPDSLNRELGRRSYPLPWARLRCRPWREAVRMISQKMKWSGLSGHETGWASTDAVYQDLDRYVARRLGRPGAGDIGGVYAYEDGAAQTFEAAQRLGLQRFYDLPIAYWETSRRLLTEEAARWPAWEPTLGGTQDSAAKLARKTRELELAEVVVCPSQFVVDSLPAWARREKKVVMIPFGSPPPDRNPVEMRPASRSDKLRVLFAGGMSQRKGLADLFAAVTQLRSQEIEFVVMGTLLAPLEFYQRECPDFIHEPSRPHGEVLRLMRSCDVLVLPSIVEGRALVMQEAMSQGLPIIITPNSGGSDLVVEEETGFLVPIRSPEAIADRLAWCAEHRDRVSQMGRNAREKVAGYTWASYGKQLADVVTRHRGEARNRTHAD